MTFVDIRKLRNDLGENCQQWLDTLPEQLDTILNNEKHGHIDEWRTIIAELPEGKPCKVNFNTDSITIGSKTELKKPDQDKLYDLLKQLHPWRKGPYTLFGIQIDTEWRSDWKWQRLEKYINNLEGKKVLDVGCGSGYHCWRMRGAGASLVVGIDPMIRFLTQFNVIKHYIADEPVHLLPLTLEQLPEKLNYFDTVFSLGVLYHRRSPVDHLYKLGECLLPGGQLVLETLIIKGEHNATLIPQKRYAKMRNVWFISDVSMILALLTRCGFSNARVVDITATTTEEQRQTDWMHFESLSDFLDPEDDTKTIEGYPAPLRAIFIAEKSW